MVAWWLVAYGLGAVMRRSLQVFVALALLIPAYSFWHATTPHAAVRVLRIAAGPGTSPNDFVLRVFYQNDGNWEAYSERLESMTLGACPSNRL